MDARLDKVGRADLHPGSVQKIHLSAGLLPIVVTALPTTGLYAGYEILYAADASNGVYWHLKYIDSSLTYPWAFIGGPSLTSSNATGITDNDATFGGADTGTFPSITLPLAGDYEVTWGGLGTVDTINSWWIIGAYQSGTLTPTDATALRCQIPTAGLFLPGFKAKRFTGLSATALTQQVRVAGGGICTVVDLELTARPVRVG